jgi:hypothetical protein
MREPSGGVDTTGQEAPEAELVQQPGLPWRDAARH